MNITPSPFDDASGSYTIVGGSRLQRRGRRSTGLSALVLHRGGRFNRAEQLAELEALGVSEIIAIESKSASYDVEQLAKRFTRVQFLLLHEDLNPGQMINLGLQEAASSHVLVIWNDMRVQSVSDRVLQRIMAAEQVCAAPLLRNERSEVIPSVLIPAFYRRTIRLIPAVPSRDGQPSLFPYDYAGIYNVERFLSLGGYDGSMASAYWQKMDFGMRTYLWGGSISCNASFRAQQTAAAVSENATPDVDYLRFFLKNIAIRFSGDHAFLRRSVLVRLLLHPPIGWVETIHEYRRIRKWIYSYRYRYMQDARRLLELWEEQ